MELFYLLLYPLFFLLLVVTTRSKLQRPCYMSVLAIYLISGVACIIFYSTQTFKSPVSFVAVLYHIFMLGLLIIPFKNFDKFAFSESTKVPEKTLRPLVFILIIASLYSIYDSSQNISLEGILTDVTSIRAELAEGQQSSGGLLEYISYYARIYWSIALILMFYYLIYFPKKKIIIFLLLISSFSQVIESFTIAGRDIVLKYIFVFFILILLFRFELPKKIKYTLNGVFIIVVACFIAFFALISILRFDMNDTASSSTQDALIAYAGQPFLFFSEFFDNFASKGATDGAIHFPLFTQSAISRFNLSDSVRTNMSLNTFSTSIGTWLFETGALIATIITVIHSILINNLKRKKKTIFSLIYVIWGFEFIFFSLFYYVYTINLSFIASILFIKMLEILFKLEKKSIRLN